MVTYKSSPDYSVSVLTQSVTTNLNDPQKEGYQLQRKEAKSSPKVEDELLVCVQEEEGAQEQGPGAGSTAPAIKAPLKAPVASEPQDSDTLPKSTSIVAIIGAVLALQVKNNSNFWSTMWQQATQSMELAIDLAQPIADAVKGYWNEQAKQTKADADMARAEGWVYVTMAGTALVTAGGSAIFGEEAAATENGLSKTTTNEAGKAGQLAEDAEAAQQANAPTNTANNTAAQTESEAAKAAQKPSSKLGRFWEALKGYGGKAYQAAGRGLDVMDKRIIAIQLFGNVPIKTYIEPKYQTKKKEAQTEAGKQDSISKQDEQYAQYYQQNFNREEDLRQGSQQNIDLAMQILKSASDTVTQTVLSMFRG